ncbi:hypothetical protein [Streptosporangium jomthongense]|uniref:Uncharacterized protein n=1 Tax=Streptosporangium jomthongense TaxID=1193683 RepID=A0ABV8FGQ4_9ACTN
MPDLTTAHRLAAYREELIGAGFSPEETRALVIEAARHQCELWLHPDFVARAVPVVPYGSEAAHA